MSLNVLFITADQWRGDSLGYAGHRLVKTPNLDALAAEGTAFLNHYANAAPCSPARACLYTGLYQMNNRVVINGSPLAARFDNVARAARRVGYAPTLLGYTDQAPDPATLPAGDPALTTYEGVLPGFDVRVKLPEHEQPWLDWLRTQGLDFPDRDAAHLPTAHAGNVSNAPPAYSKDQTQTAFIANAFIDWLGAQSAPWFAHLSFLRPHPPFIAPAPYNTMYRPEDVGDFVRPATPEAEAAIHPLMHYALGFTPRGSFIPGATGLVKDLSEADFRQLRATYFGMISEVDTQLGRVFAAARSAGQWNETLVIFTSDHAEMMGDHFTLGKGGFYDQSQHIPLVIRDPRAGAKGVRVAAVTEAVDLYPTLLEAIGAAPTHVADGASLLPFLSGDTPADWRDAAHWEFDFRDIAGERAEAWFDRGPTELNLCVLRTADWKYVHFASLPPLLFDLRADPGCLHNRAGDPALAAVQLEMAERMLAWRAAHLDQTLALQSTTPEGIVSRLR